MNTLQGCANWSTRVGVREHPQEPGSSWGIPQSGEAGVAAPRLLHPPALPPPQFPLQAAAVLCSVGLGQCSLDEWAFCPQLHQSQALSPTCQPTSLLLLPFLLLLLQGFFLIFFFFPLAKSIYGQLTHFPPCKLIRYSVPASTRKHPLSQGGLETPSLAVITSEQFDSLPARLQDFPIQPCPGLPRFSKETEIFKHFSPLPS